MHDPFFGCPKGEVDGLDRPPGEQGLGLWNHRTSGTLDDDDIEGAGGRKAPLLRAIRELVDFDGAGVGIENPHGRRRVRVRA